MTMKNKYHFLETAKVTSKGQITIPSDIRRKLNLNKGDVVTFGVNDDGIMIINNVKNIEINEK